jgi:hypothetical protein
MNENEAQTIDVTPPAEEVVVQETQQAEVPPWEQNKVEAPAPQQSNDTANKKQDGLNKRFSELTAQRRAAEERARVIEDQNRQLLDLLSKGRTQSDAGNVDKSEGQPQLEQFDSYEKYQGAIARWEAKQVYAAERKAEQERIQKEQSEAKHRELVQTQHQRVLEHQSKLNSISEEAEKKFPDFHEVAFASDVQITPLMGEAILESDKPDELLYHLGKHKEEALRISKLSPSKQLLELGKLEVSLSKVKSAAPPPIDPLTGKNASSDLPSSNDDMETWIAKRNRQLGRK